ncbi:S1C family serine protease [Gephyromycinifex aptenodytis]|uniref:S1C family serine protease n=1 Tax=Gephyromycinifex aptenodytis TaxID=2716227 RepID=UPI001446AD0D|nr:trypsin-like peptidase domain-containing protein [Gephyromycinifex aptenodytis]
MTLPPPEAPRSDDTTWHGSSPANAPYPVMSSPPRRRRRWLGPVLAALLALFLLLGVAVVATQRMSGTESKAPMEGPRNTAPVGPVIQADGSAPDWSATAAAAAPSVVAISVQTGNSGGEGSGVIFDSAGHIVTNHHVVASGASQQAQILVTLQDQRVFTAKIVGTDPATDLAVLKLDNAPDDLRPITPGNDQDLKVGQPVMAIGNPLGLAGTVTTGIVSALNRPVSTTQDPAETPFGTTTRSEEVVTNAIQTSAAINPGNSGGALVDASGKLVGINSSIASLSESSGNIGIGFAIPVTEVQSVARQLIATGEVKHPYLGVRLNDAVAAEGSARRRAAGIVRVEQGTPAAKAGFEAGDAVIAVDGEPVDGARSLTAQVREREVGQEATFTIVRDGKRQDIKTTLAQRSNN